jgi:hypothetical protein
MRAMHEYAWIANHYGRCPSNRISRSHMGQECVGHLGRPIENTFPYFIVRTNVFEYIVIIWVGPLEMPLQNQEVPRILPLRPSCTIMHRFPNASTRISIVRIITTACEIVAESKPRSHCRTRG